MNISQEQLADSANLDRTYISGFERGLRNISILSLEKILVGLHLSCDAFLRLCMDKIKGANDEKPI